MILNTPNPIPDFAVKALEDRMYVEECGRQVRRCDVLISEENAITYFHPESFDLCDVYGECEVAQAIVDGNVLPPVVTKFESSKNHRSFEAEAAAQQGIPTEGRGVILVLEPEPEEKA